MGVFAILLSLALLIYLAFKGVSVLILGPVLAMLIAFIGGDMPTLYALTGPFMQTTAAYIGAYFPIFLAGAVFGKIMGETGAAKVIAHFISRKLGTKRATLAVALATSLLTYGGVSLFVVVFAVYPIGVALYREAGIPKRLLPAAIALGAFTFTMTAMPGSPQYLNSMPTNYLGTDIYAAPILGIIASVLIFSFGVMWLNFRTKKAHLNGEGFGEHHEVDETNDDGELPSFVASVTPILLIFVLNWVLVNIIFKSSSSLAKYENFGGVNGNWPVAVALSIAIVLSIFLYRKQIPDTKELLGMGAQSSLAPIFNTAVIVGFGGVITNTAAFEMMKQWILNLAISGLSKVAISTSLVSAIVGSSSGGAGIALEALSSNFLAMGLNPEAIHRVMLVAAGGLDSLPHSGAVITLLAVCSINHREGYLDVGMLTVVIPVLATVSIILIHLATGVV
jgi:H+/gluconate symporter-like permease